MASDDDGIGLQGPQPQRYGLLLLRDVVYDLLSSDSPQSFSKAVRVDAPPARIWPYVCDTDRLNKAVGLPKVSYLPPPSGGVVRQASIRFRGIQLATWDEHPFDWVEADHFLVRRDFHGGPFASFEGGVRLKPDGAGTLAEAHGDFVPNGFLGRLLAPLVGGKGSADMAAAVGKVGAWACAGGGCDDDPLRPAVPKDNVDRTRLERLLGRVREKGDPGVLERLRRHIETAEDQDTALLRPFELADRWGLDRLATLCAFLAATREGVLDLRWELLCPHCRVSKSSSSTLSGASSTAHCDFCNADFSAELDVNMELRFSPHPSIRPVSASTFCIGGPGNSRHRPAQVRLAPGASRVIRLPLKSRRYIVRGLLGKAEFLLMPDSVAGPTAAAASMSSGEVKSGEAHFKPGLVELTLANAGPEAWAVVEEVEWADTAATAAFVTSLQDFKDLFSSEVLAVGTEVSVRSLALLFTDLKGSTAMYERVGDARAYSVVRDHFGVLFEVVRKRRGAVVKTIGDAVMAAFSDPADAVAAALEMHDALHARNKTLTVPVILKVGVHEGPAIAINSGGVLDYFGTTVNLAARVQSESEGGDVVLTASVLASARAAGLVKKSCDCSADFETTVRGLAAPVRLTRVWPRSSVDAGLGPG